MATPIDSLVVDPMHLFSGAASTSVYAERNNNNNGDVSTISAPAAATLQNSKPTAVVSPPLEEEDEYLRLAQRYYLPYDMVVEAKRMFDYYRMHDEPSLEATRKMDSSIAFLRTSSHRVIQDGSNNDDSEGGSSNLLSADSMGDDSSPIPLGLSAKVASEEEEADVIAVSGLQAFFKDLGISKSPMEIVDIIQKMAGSPRDVDLLIDQQRELIRLEEERAEQALLQNQGNSGRKKHNRTPSAQTVSMTSSPVPAPATVISVPCVRDTPPRGLTFDLFVFLLQQRLCEAEDSAAFLEAEAEDVFRLLDRDGDGALSEKDVRQCLATLLVGEGTLAVNKDMLQLASLHPVELRTALEECDVNADGIVTFSDFLSIQRAS